MPSFIARNIPNTLTCCKIISGIIATKLAFECNTEWAMAFIIIGAVFDFFDGFSARLLHVSSPIGKELDSLADVTTFGVAPSAIVFSLLSAYSPDIPLLPYTAFLIAAFSALRLAKFNLDTRQTTSFIGLPTPANALLWGAIAIECTQTYSTRQPLLAGIITGAVAVTCGLLVAEIPMFALKFKNFRLKDNALRYFFIVTSLALILIFHILGIALTIVWYIILSILTQRNSKNGTPFAP